MAKYEKSEGVQIRRTRSFSKKEKPVEPTYGKRKDAIARATIKNGNPGVFINKTPLHGWGTLMARMKIQEALKLAENVPKDKNISVNVKGGGVTGQTDAVRQAIARGLVKIAGKELKETYLDYDKSLLVFDIRRNEPHHAGGASRRGSRRHKQRSKR